MTRKHLSCLLAASALLLGAGFAAAADKAPEAVARPQAPSSAPAAPSAKATSTKAAHKAVPRGKLVDINSAAKPALKKLPGISDALADKIIANRPYGSKTWLVSNNVLEAATFQAIKRLIEAKQPFKTAAENAAFYDKLKKDKASKP